MTGPVTPAPATVILKTLAHPHAGIPGGSLAAPDEVQLKDAATDGIKDADSITKAAAEAFYDARLAASEWVVEPYIRTAPLGRTPIRPIGLPGTP